jgi:oxygen-dependent protoporphyrinogen oxidase
MRDFHVAIIGGGITGLSAAWALQQAARAGQPVRYTVLEASGRWGGKVMTETVDLGEESPFIVEAGPDAFLTQKPWALELARELGLEARLLGTNDAARHIDVLHKGRPVKLPDGVMLIVPTQWWPFVRSRLISPLGKLRMALDWLIPARRDDADETLADFVLRRLGREALDTLAAPLMSGIYNAEADRQSIMATFPRFRQVERAHGSLIRGMLAARRASAERAPGISAFASLRGGTGELIEALVAQLDGDLRLNTAVAAIARGDHGYTLTTAAGDTLHADAVIFTTPAYIAAELLRPLAPIAADLLAAIRYVGTGTLSLAYRADDVRRPLHGFGLVIPARERRRINALTVTSTKFDQRAPSGTVLLRAFFGGSRTPEAMHYDDDHLLEIVRDELRDLLGIEAAPLFHRIYRWPRANPQYDLGHLDRAAAIEAALPPGLYMTGSAMRGVGMPDCVHQAQQTAAETLAHLRTLPTADPVILNAGDCIST